MEKIPLLIFRWTVPVLFLAAGLFLHFQVHGHQFLSMICVGIAAVLILYNLLDLFKSCSLTAAKLMQLILSFLLCVGILIFLGTEFLIVRASSGSAEADCPYILVLGAKVNGTQPSISLSDRIDAAEEYLRGHPDTVAVLSGGQGDDEDISEAQCMYEQLTARGIPASLLWLEDRSTSTWENLNNSLDLIEEKTGTRPTSIGLLSSEYHLFRAGLFAKQCGVEAVGIPAATSWPTIRLNYFLREVAGVWHYLLLGN